MSVSVQQLFDFAVITIFARETLEGGIIIGEYRTVILRMDTWASRSSDGVTQKEALRAVTVSALLAPFAAIVVCAAVAIPLALLSKDFDNRTAVLIEGISKIVAAVCLLQLSLKMPKFFGLYYSNAQLKRLRQQTEARQEQEEGTNIDTNDNHIHISTPPNTQPDLHEQLSLRSIRFNVAWNIWREVAECGVFLIPFFLTGEGIVAIPLSAAVGFLCGAAICLLIYYANSHFQSTVGLTVFTVGLLLLLSTGLFSGGCHNIEVATSSTTNVVYTLEGQFWSVNRLPMTLLKPFGYSDEKTVLQIVAFWVWLLLGLTLHYLKYKRCRKPLTPSVELETCDTAHPYNDADVEVAEGITEEDDLQTKATEKTPSTVRTLGTETDLSRFCR
jgi:high-affinity iron transporter